MTRRPSLERELLEAIKALKSAHSVPRETALPFLTGWFRASRPKLAAALESLWKAEP